jgi:hypothetical protein
MPVGLANRRTFIAGLGGAAAWPVVAPAQSGKRPLVGILALSPLSRARPTSQHFSKQCRTSDGWKIGILNWRIAIGMASPNCFNQWQRS